MKHGDTRTRRRRSSPARGRPRSRGPWRGAPASRAAPPPPRPRGAHGRAAARRRFRPAGCRTTQPLGGAGRRGGSRHVEPAQPRHPSLPHGPMSSRRPTGRRRARGSSSSSGTQRARSGGRRGRRRAGWRPSTSPRCGARRQQATALRRSRRVPALLLGRCGARRDRRAAGRPAARAGGPAGAVHARRAGLGRAVDAVPAADRRHRSRPPRLRQLGKPAQWPYSLDGYAFLLRSSTPDRPRG